MPLPDTNSRSVVCAIARENREAWYRMRSPMVKRTYHSVPPMRYRRFDPLGRDLSVLVLGTALYRLAAPDASAELLDAWVERGGNVLDTGREYGTAETVIGRWLAGAKPDVVVLTKAAHQDETRR